MNKILEKYIKDLALGITNLIDIFEPEIISIGGSFSFYKDVLLDRLKEELKNMPKISCSNIPDIVVAELKNDAGIIGAVL